MSQQENKKFKISKELKGMITPENFDIADAPAPQLPAKGVVLRLMVCSVDPYLRPTFTGPDHVGTTIRNFSVGTVVESSDERFPVGSIVTGLVSLEKLVAVDTSKETNLRICRALQSGESKIHPSHYVGVLGMPGATAFGAVRQILKVKQGDVVLVSGAAGCVGGLVGQFCRLMGARKVIGVAGGPEKCKFVKEKFGFDECIDYKTIDQQASMTEKIEQMKLKYKEVLGDESGFDCYYDNTGGYITHGVWDFLNYKARVAICGQISEYNNETPEMFPSFLFKLVYKCITIQGFVVNETFYEGLEETVVPWIKENKLHVEETILQGFHELPNAFVGLFKGANYGKMVVSV